MTKETDLTGLVNFIPLEEEQWTEVLANAKVEAHRDWMDELFDRAGYSMEASCKKLLGLYGSI